jgi:hypothetical protein
MASVRSALIFGLVGMMAFVLAHPPMWGIGEPAFVGGDATRVFWADLVFAREALASGTLPLWNPYDRAGYPFVAEPHSGMFDPVQWFLIAVALGLGSAPSWLVTVKSVLLYGIAAAGVAAFLQDRLASSGPDQTEAPRWAVTLGVLAIVLGPRMDALKDQSALWPTAWVGWLLLAVDRCMRLPSPRRGVWMGAAASMTVIAGHPPGAFRLSLLAVPYAIALVASKVHGTDDRRAYLRELVRACGVAVLVVMVLTAGQIRSTTGVLPGTERAAFELDDILASTSIPAHAMAIFAPAAEMTPLLVYVGFGCALGVLASLWRARTEDLVLVGVGVLGFLLACGGNAPVLPKLAALPGSSAVPIAGHDLVLPVLVLALLGPIGLARLIARSRLMPAWPPLLVVGSGVLAFFVFAEHRGPTAVLVVVLTGTVVLVAAFSDASRRKRRLGWILVPVLAFDLFVASRPIAELLEPLPDPANGRTMAESIDRSSIVRIADFGWADRRVGPREGVRDLVGHRSALTDRRYTMLYEAAPTWSSLLQGGNVALVGYAGRAAAPRGARLEPVAGQRALYRVPDPWPMAFWTRDVAVVGSAEHALALLQARRDPGAVIEEGTIDGDVAERLRRLADVRGQPAAARLLEQSLHRLELEIEAPHDGLLVVLEAYERGWRATVDGESAVVHRANLVFRAIEVPAGVHRVTLTYDPVGVRGLFGLWVLGMLGLVALGFDEIRRARASATGNDEER